MDRAGLRLEIGFLFASVNHISKVFLTELSHIILDNMSGGVLAGIVKLSMDATHLVIQLILDLLGCNGALCLTFETGWARAGMPGSTRVSQLLLAHAHIVLRCW